MKNQGNFAASENAKQKLKELKV